MSHSLAKLWVHVIFSTKYRDAQILPAIESEVHRAIFYQLVRLGCYVEALDGMPDHVHILFLLPPQVALSEVIRYTKGGSAHDINSKSLLRAKFAWQTGYWAYSVSESRCSVIKRYIQNQKTHHRIQDFAAEIAALELLHGLRPHG